MTINVDPEEMADIARRLFIAELSSDLGPDSGGIVRELIEVVRRVHRAITTERLTGRLVVVRVLDSEDFWIDTASEYFDDLASLGTYYDGQGPLIVKLEGTGIRVWKLDFAEPEGREYVFYEYVKPYEEYLACHKRKHEVPRIATSPSYFGLPYFRQLRVALEKYGRIWIRESQCDTFATSWFDPKRTLFQPGPEYIMRRSLQRFLRSHLRDQNDVQIMPEQNVDETKPVDIKVVWSVYNRVALIEIKWLGNSASASGTKLVTYSQSRAKSGAAQLADYLDRYSVEQPDEEVRGYLVVFDARRRGVTNPPTELSREEAIYYRDKAIEYDGTILDRPDFDPPHRFFCEPVVSTG
ncbi:MAG: hypothetical protein PGN27_07975 [Mycolicibacterium neoaurum]|uniref:hypothetical protein n=1 Tax=Mycolicibacterium neoaurum TaxID=1795 RepID=UPI002FF673B5